MVFRPERMRFGVFMPPHHHPVGISPSVAYEWDLHFLEKLDAWGYDEAWIGEHHSGGAEIYSDPALMIVAAAARTKRIMLGTGVVNLPLHHPFIVADQMTMLDHLTRGRAMLGVGSGALAADFSMMGKPLDQKRRYSEEALEAIVALLRNEEPVTMKTDWFELNEARLQLPSFTRPHMTVAVAGASSVDGSSSAGRLGLRQITPANRSNPDAGRDAWKWYEDAAQKAGRVANRADWTMMTFFHIAETREEAINDIRYGLKYLTTIGLVGGTVAELDDPNLPQYIAERGRAIIGTPDDAVEAIERLVQDSGGFGGIIGSMFGLANPEKTLRSYELMARYVMPHFQGVYDHVRANREWTLDTGGGPGGSGRNTGVSANYAQPRPAINGANGATEPAKPVTQG